MEHFARVIVRRGCALAGFATLAVALACAFSATRIESLGSPGADRLRGTAGPDLLKGLDGDDRLAGGAGDDHLVGGRGDDVLIGGPGKDLLEGGPGADRFVFTPAAIESGPDRVVDFRPAEGDSLVFAGFGHGFDSKQVDVAGSTVALKSDGVEVERPVAHIDDLDVSLGTLARKDAIRFQLKIEF